jgi:hypothetical protein
MGQPLEIFLCERRTLTLSTAGCAKLYISANGGGKRPEAYEGRSACVTCPIGAFNATGKVQNPITVLANSIRLLCPRCGRLAECLINGTLCRSCHARHLEGIARKNAKGTVPALSAKLHTERVAVSSSTARPHIVSNRGVASLPEAIIHMSKSATGPTTYGRRRMQWHDVPQLEMAL